MRHRILFSLSAVLLAVVACGIPSAAPPPTVPALPPTPDFSQVQPVAPAAPLPTAAPASTFAGTWTGPDPDDGSFMTLVLAQNGSSLSGTYKDSFSGTLPPPGFEGTVSGSTFSDTSGQISLDMRRQDGATLLLQADLALSDQGQTLTVTITSAGATPWVLHQ